MLRTRDGVGWVLARTLTALAVLTIFLELARFWGWEFPVNFKNIPTLNDLADEFCRQARNHEFYSNIADSLVRVLSGFTLATLVAIPLAFLSRNRFVDNYILPLFEIARPVPNVVWVPVSILAFSTIEESVLFITFIGAFFPILVNSVHAFRNLPLTLTRTSHVLGVPKMKFVFEVLLPASLPNVFVGLSLGMSGAWLGLVVAEMIAGRSGIGYFTWINFTLINIPGVFCGMATIATLGVLSTSCVAGLSRVLVRT